MSPTFSIDYSTYGALLNTKFLCERRGGIQTISVASPYFQNIFLGKFGAAMISTAYSIYSDSEPLKHLVNICHRGFKSIRNINNLASHGGIKGYYLFSQFFGYFGSVMCVTPYLALSSLEVHVPRIVCASSKKKVTRVNAWPIITAMTYANPFWNGTIGKFPGHSGWDVFFHFVTKYPISTMMLRADPRPAFVWTQNIYSLPKFFRQRLSDLFLILSRYATSVFVIPSKVLNICHSSGILHDLNINGKDFYA